MTTLFFYSYLLPLFFSFQSGLKAFRPDWPKPFRLFCVFLLMTLMVELFAIAWKSYLHQTAWWHYQVNNLWIYNTYLLPQYLFYIYFFASTIHIKIIKKVAYVVAVLYILIALPNLLYVQQLFIVNYYTILAANFIVIGFSVTYFTMLMRAKTVAQLSRQPLFWIAAGAFIFHLGSLPCFILYNYLSSADLLLASSLFRIIVVLNFIMYSSYTIAFLCTKKYPISPF